MHLGRTLLFLGSLAIGVVCVAGPAATAEAPGIGATHMLGPMPAEGAGLAKESTADHRKFKELDKRFRKTGQVIKACLQCHTEAARQVHGTKHWTWEFDNPVTGQKVGARHLLNNFFISTRTNMASCSYCHIGTGWKGDKFDLGREDGVDCLICHDTTGTYAFKKFHKARGNCHVCHEEIPESPGKKKRRPDLKKIAKNVGPSSRRNCGSCHFIGGGGTNVKHGDLDPSLTEPNRKVDVHMASMGADFTCTTCHSTDQHAVRGSRYATVATDTYGANAPGRGPVKRGTCRSCHGMRPMHDDKLNDHTDKVACQTCHIPTYARGGHATKTFWDWSTSRRLDDDGKPVVEKDAEGRVVYTSQKGHARWEENVVPEYRWFNGSARYTQLDDEIDPAGPVAINTFLGGPGDPEARIWPVKRSLAKQPYDTETNKLVAVKMFALHRSAKDQDAYWSNLDWPRAIEAGMKAEGKGFSGNVGFVDTEMLWPITHMVAPVREALGCGDCHATDGRLSGVDGVYLPGRDRFAAVEWLGGLMLLGTVGGVLVHGFIRIATRSRRRAKP